METQSRFGAVNTDPAQCGVRDTRFRSSPPAELRSDATFATDNLEMRLLIADGEVALALHMRPVNKSLGLTSGPALHRYLRNEMFSLYPTITPFCFSCFALLFQTYANHK